MIDLRNTCVLVRTKVENEMLLKEAEKQEFHWTNREGCEPLREQPFPDVLKFYKDKSIAAICNISSEYTFYEASELLGTKEMTAREFVEWYVNVDTLCINGNYKCDKCTLSRKNTKCNSNLCNIHDWKGNVDELIEIVKSGKMTVSTPEEKAIGTLESFIDNPDRAALNDEFVDALKLAVEKLKEVK